MDENEDFGADLAEMGVITTGDLLSTGARAVGANFAAFVTVAVLVMSPAIVANILFSEWVQARLLAVAEDPYAMSGDVQSVAMMSGLGGMGVLFLQTVANFMAQAMLMYATVEFMAGRRATVGDALTKGISNAPVVLAIAILSTIIIGVGTLLCIIPGIIATCALFAAVPAAVVERLGPIDALRRSADLTTGHRMTIFLALLAIGLTTLAFSCGFGAVIGGGEAAAGLGDPGVVAQPSSLAVRALNYGGTWTINLGQLIVQAAVAAVFYARVRGIRDHVDAGAIADVFA